MERTYYDSRGKSHSNEDNAQGANRRYARENLRQSEESNQLQRAQVEATALAGMLAVHQLKEQERQNSCQQRHNEEMEELESARLEAQRQQMQYQKDLACLEGEPVATRAEYLVKRALENSEMPFDEVAFESHLNEMFGEMAKARLIDLKAQARKARIFHHAAWEEHRRGEAEVAKCEPDVHQTRPENPFTVLKVSSGVLACLFVLFLVLSLACDGGLFPALLFTGFSAAIGSPIILTCFILELSRLPKAKRAHRQAQEALAKAVEQKLDAQAMEAGRKADLERAQRQVSDEVGRVKAKLIEHFHSKSHEEFIRAQQPLISFAEFVWLQVSGFQADLPPRCKVARDSITAELCESHYPVLLEQSVSKSIKWVTVARLDGDAPAAKHDADRGHQPPMNSCDPVHEQDFFLTQSPELSASENESKLYLFGPDVPAHGYRITAPGTAVITALRQRTENHPSLRSLGQMDDKKTLWSLARNGYVLAIRYKPGAFNDRYGDGIVVVAKEPVKFQDNVIRNFNMEALTPVFWFNGEKTKRMSFKEFNGEKLTKDEQAKLDALEMCLSMLDDKRDDVHAIPWNS